MSRKLVATTVFMGGVVLSMLIPAFVAVTLLMSGCWPGLWIWLPALFSYLLLAGWGLGTLVDRTERGMGE